MLNHLVESTSQLATLKRRTSFFLATLCGYALLLFAAGVASVYAYDASLAAEAEEHVEFLILEPLEEPRDPAPRTLQLAAFNPAASRPTPFIRREAVAQIDDLAHVPDKISTAPQTVRSVPPGHLFKIGATDEDGTMIVPGAGTGSRSAINTMGAATTGSIAKLGAPPPPAASAARAEKPVEPVKPKRRVSIGVVNGRALNLPQPIYTQAARQVRAAGTVTVQVIIDEFGKVISARAVDGHPLLRREAVNAALRAHFKPTLLSNEPVPVQGIIKYQFKLE